LLSGEFERTVDYKGRLTLPTGLLLSTPETDWSKVQILKGTERPSLHVYDLATWRSILREAHATMDDDEGRVFMHRVLSDAHLSDVDPMNRVTLPAPLLEYAQVEKKAVVVGMFQRLEVWSPELWNEYMGEMEEVAVPSISDLSRARIRQVS
jgi:MraZ protein